MGSKQCAKMFCYICELCERKNSPVSFAVVLSDNCISKVMSYGRIYYLKFYQIALINKNSDTDYINSVPEFLFIIVFCLLFNQRDAQRSLSF